MGKFGPPSKWLKDQRETMPLQSKDLSERIILVVGGNTGLGLEASRHLAAMKPQRLIIACRDATRGKNAVNDIERTTGVESIELALVDLTDFKSIPSFVELLRTSLGISRIDAILLNAGMMTPNFQLTKDGWETTLQTNYIGTALLAFHLLPFLLHSPLDGFTPRLVFVGSEVHYFVSKVEQEESQNILLALNDKKTAAMSQRYYITKTLNLFFARSLASKISHKKLIITSTNPGFCKSGLIRNSNPVQLLALKAATFLLSRSTEMGSRCLVHALLSDNADAIHGKYLNNCRVEEESDFVLSEDGQRVQARVWNELSDVLFKVDPRVKDIVEKYLVETR
ncbi:short-chain dehydrogenase [Lentinula raphanica]|uniref:Short-chain dehydrogenase n=1 Tax=Lentinula raphanica TaxID=153919 RepID=A0AA38NX03_9AGAR|nr:short-chain dehydrogenase [Lentinula raphanica]